MGIRWAISKLLRWPISISKGPRCDNSLLLPNLIQQENIRRRTNRVISRTTKWLCSKTQCYSHMLEPVSFPCRGSDVPLNTVQVWHPSWHLYNQCSFKAGDLWRFSIYCHLPQFSGSFLPRHQSRATLMQTISLLTWGGRRRMCFHNSPWSVMFFLPSFLCQRRHTRACHLALEFFMPVHLHDHNPVSLELCRGLRWGRAGARQVCLFGIVNARAVLFQGVALHSLAVGAIRHERLKKTTSNKSQFTFATHVVYTFAAVHLSHSHSAGSHSYSVATSKAFSMTACFTWKHNKTGGSAEFSCVHFSTCEPNLQMIFITTGEAAGIWFNHLPVCLQTPHRS